MSGSRRGPGTEGLLGARSRAPHRERRTLSRRRSAMVGRACCTRYSTERVASQTGVPADTIVRLADEFARTRPSLAIGGGAAGNHTNGVDILIAVNVLNYLAGNVGVSGGLIFNPPPVAGAESVPRRASYRTMLELAEDARAGRIDVLILNKTNPVFALPAAARFKEALADIPMIVSLSSFMDETTAFADLILPAHTYLESWGDDFPEPGVGFPVGAIAQPVVSPSVRHARDRRHHSRLSRNASILAPRLPWTNMEACRQGRLARNFPARRARRRSRKFRNVLDVRPAGRSVGPGRPPHSHGCTDPAKCNRRNQRRAPRRRRKPIPSSCILICRSGCTMVAARIFPGCRSCPIR